MWVSSVSGWVQEEQSDDLFGKCLYNKKYLMGKLQKKVQEAVIGENEVQFKVENYGHEDMV